MINRAPATPSSSGRTVAETPINLLSVISTDGQLTLPIGKAGEVSLGNAVTVSIPIDASAQ